MTKLYAANESSNIEMIKKEFTNWNQKQLLSLIVVVLICLIVSLIVYIKLKHNFKKDKAPKGIVFVMEGYVNYVDDLYDNTSDGKLPKMKFYIFGLATFLFVGNLLGLIGLEPIATSYSVALTCGLITFIGIYVIGFIYQKFRFFKRYINPIEIIGQFSPLISITFRIFGNLIGGGLILFLIYYFFGWVWTKIPGQTTAWPLLAPLVTPFLHMYFDIFSVFIQTLVFCSLTTIWWSREVEDDKNEVKAASQGTTISGLETNNAKHTKKITLNHNIY